MCLAVCGRIKSVDNPFAFVDIKGIETCINVELVDDPKKGDYVLIHAGFAIEKVNREYFQYLDDTLEEMLKEDNDYDG
ncbi:HypC/HybG/HupF family hydrogenase formation chaperone [Clostridium sp. MB40-C1]|uniref:HypC/HybG/HupF family hydrogenase formation chaperone n=1 Tax=Clostridium sp. MB40-C1 TaxID=3070996 RepID=UPI0027E09A72|nr:HypC/HybG/HupF family hydrogenase formation chaperone [Clostridium sp. MB40-C1]WMJ80208.1 HypC/HybG/HupF family hydrogenase formation chaperone [Clostridium sp. MB40-C1]